MREAILLFLVKELVDTEVPVQYVLVIMSQGNMPFFQEGSRKAYIIFNELWEPFYSTLTNV